MNFDLKTALASFAPTLATMLAGPMAGTAVAALESALGLNVGSGVPAINAAMQAGAMTPETIGLLRAADLRHAEIMSQQNIDLQRINLDHEAAMAAGVAADRNSARRREVDAKDSLTPRWLAAAITLGFFGVLGYMLVAGKPLIGGDALLVMLGSLGTSWASCVGYYFGSSAGSSHKDSLLANKPDAKG